MITIVSKEKERVQFQTKIVEFARGLEHYSTEEDIVFEELITTDFLNAFKEFYEGNEYNIENLKVKLIVFILRSRTRQSNRSRWIRTSVLRTLPS